MICNKETVVQKTAPAFRVRQNRAQKYVWWVIVTPAVFFEAEELGAFRPTGHGTSKMTNTIMMTPPSSRAAALRALMTILHFCLFLKDTSVSCDKGLGKFPVLVVFSSLLLGVVEVVVLGAVSDEADLLFAG